MKVLIIEDENELLTSLSQRLRGEGYTVDTASDGEKGSVLARNSDYDIVILDITLPKKSGIDVCREVRNVGINTPIIVLSATTDCDSKVELLNTGADDYITKPFSYKELSSRINAISRRPKDLIETVLKISDLTLDTRTHTVKRGSKGIYLTRKEFSLLEFLLRHKGSILSRTVIIDHVWSADSDPFSNTIEAHIRNLRVKIRGGNNKKLIHNVPGRGYKIGEVGFEGKRN